MNIEKLIYDVVEVHNRRHQEIIIRKSQCDSISLYFLYCRDSNIWDAEECRFFLSLYETLSKDMVYPFIDLMEINGEYKIGILFDVNSEL